MKNYPNSLKEFISKFNEEKLLHLIPECDLLENETEIVDSIVEKNILFADSNDHDAHLNSNKNAISESNCSDAGSENVSNMTNVTPKEFEFKQNRLFHFFNSSLEGLTVLGKYKKSKFLDRGRLKNLIIFHELQKDPLNYK